jgi:hypothetical protein
MITLAPAVADRLVDLVYDWDKCYGTPAPLSALAHDLQRSALATALLVDDLALRGRLAWTAPCTPFGDRDVTLGVWS